MSGSNRIQIGQKRADAALSKASALDEVIAESLGFLKGCGERGDGVGIAFAGQ